MKKSLLFCLMAVVAMVFAACGPEPKTPDNGTVLMGWCNNTMEDGVGNSGSHVFKAAIQLVDTQWVNKATKLVGVRVGIAGEIENGQIWLANTMDGEPFYTQDFTFQGEGWQYITLNEPYKLVEGQELWIGYSVKGAGYVIGYQSASNKKKESDRIAIDDTWHRLGDAGITGRVCIQAIGTGCDYSAMTQKNFVFSELEYDEYVQQSASNKVSGVVTNYGVATVKGATITFTDGANSKTITVEEDMPNGKPVRFSFDGLTAGSGESNFTLTAESEGTQCTESGKQTFYNNAAPRKVLIEQFTGSSCPNCPAGEQTLRNSIASITDQVTWITHHVGYYEDDYTVAGSKEYTWFYGTSGTYAPACMLDRTNPTAFGFKSEYPVFHPGNTTANMFKKYLNVPAFVSVNVACQLATDSTLTVTVSGQYLQELANTRMNVFLIQNHIIGFQSNGGANYDHDHTVRARFTAAWGDAVETDASGNYTMTYTYKIPASIRGTKSIDVDTDLDNMQVVAFITKYNSSDRNGCQVMNSNIANVK